MNTNIKLNHKSDKYLKSYVKELTQDLDSMVDKMRKNELDVDAYQQWSALICSALDLIKNK
jgi:hypothetical protein|tara:strand:- start:332 stop:514 length:183 start_codon:yes stop_codon:yes gene_type:complete